MSINVRKKLVFWLVWFLLSVIPVAPTLAGNSVWLVDIEGPIGPAMSDHVVRNIDQANDQAVEAIILRMNTPGGLDGAMRDIIKAILGSDIPVITYVAPKGSRAASAGTYILLASHIAAMSPATHLGAATPVQVGGLPKLPGTEDQKPNDKQSDKNNGQDKTNDKDNHKTNDQLTDAVANDQAMRNKVVNDAKAYIRSLANMYGRNAQWAEEAVTMAATLTSTEALEKGVIDLIADDERELLDKLQGRIVSISGEDITLDLSAANIVVITPDWRSEFLSIITNPSVAYILMIIGFYGLILEFYSPGIGIGGIIGAICLFLALYALQLLPISYSALALLLLGLGLMAAEAFSPSFGVLGFGGLVAFVLGSIMLMDTELPGFQIAIPVILALAVTSLALLIIVLKLLLKTRHQPVVSGLKTLEGQQASVVNFDQGKLLVRLHGELWQAVCDSPVEKGDRVNVVEAKGLTLKVEKEHTP